jgi:hypothetical protein
MEGQMRAKGRGHVAVLSTVLAAGLVGGCAMVSPDHAPRRLAGGDGIADPLRRPGLPVLFVAMPGSAPFQATRKGLLGELVRNYDVVTFLVEPETTLQQLSAALEAAAPTCIVVMNNSTLRLYRDYQHAHPGRAFPPAVVVMTSFLEDIRGELINATGISYEVPGVTAFVGLRAIVKTPVSRVGVIHARYSQGFIERQRSLAAKEHVTILPVEVGNQPTLTEIRNAFHFLKTVNHVDTLWVLNDNRLLKDARFVVDVWQPEIEALNVPVIVGAAPLVSSQSPFGTFAVLPDHAALGVQAANLVLDLAEEGWNAGQHPIDLPLATTSVLDVTRARAEFGLRDDALKQVDVLVE